MVRDVEVDVNVFAVIAVVVFLQCCGNVMCFFIVFQDNLQVSAVVPDCYCLACISYDFYDT